MFAKTLYKITKSTMRCQCETQFSAVRADLVVVRNLLMADGLVLVTIAELMGCFSAINSVLHASNHIVYGLIIDYICIRL